jgi:hypothetical protein
MNRHAAVGVTAATCLDVDSARGVLLHPLTPSSKPISFPNWVLKFPVRRYNEFALLQSITPYFKVMVNI